jgi:CRISPR-associated endonuclease/helicase Cas3
VMETMMFDRQRQRALLQFRQCADRFRMIRDEQLPILVPHDAKAKIMWQNLANSKVPFVPQRALQPYLVSVRPQAMQQLLRQGFVMAHDSGVWLLYNRSLYTESKGLDPAGARLDESLWGV